MVTRTKQRPEAFAETLRKLVRAADPRFGDRQYPLRWKRASRTVSSCGGRRRCWQESFPGVALLLAAIGTYGVLSYACRPTGQREIGIRMAVGAQRWQIGSQFLSLSACACSEWPELSSVRWVRGSPEKRDAKHPLRRAGASSRHSFRHRRSFSARSP